MENGPSGDYYLFPIALAQHMIGYIDFEQNKNRNNPFPPPPTVIYTCR